LPGEKLRLIWEKILDAWSGRGDCPGGFRGEGYPEAGRRDFPFTVTSWGSMHRNRYPDLSVPSAARLAMSLFSFKGRIHRKRYPEKAV